jgi:hypothetical protein
MTQLISIATECPPNLDWQIAFGDRANSGNRFVQIEFFITEVEWNDRWQNLKILI